MQLVSISPGEILLPVRFDTGCCCCLSVFDWLVCPFVAVCPGSMTRQTRMPNLSKKGMMRLSRERTCLTAVIQWTLCKTINRITVRCYLSHLSIYVIVYFSSVSSWMKLTNCKFPLIKTYLALYEAGWPSALALPCSFLFHAY